MGGRFEGKRVIVTGGASGIGLAVVERAVAEGATVAIWDRDQAKADAVAARFGGKVHAFGIDITDWDVVQAAADVTAETLGGIDVLVAAAGITGPNEPVEDYPVEAWRQVFDVNVHGVFHTNKAAIPHLKSSKAGRIINVASVAGKEGNPNASAYSASKAAVIGFTKSLGKELAATPITVNCVTPAAVRTPIFDQMSQSHIDYMLSKIPMGRFGTVEEIAALILWLASDEASFSTGAAFDCSGGRATY